jgi:hypothetical protein
MSDIPNRDELERKLARMLAGLLRAQMGHLLELLGDPPNLDNVTSAFWDEQGVEFAKVMRPFSQNVYLVRAEQTIADSVIGVDWGLVNESAVDWARQYTFDLVKGINNTSRKLLQTSVGDFFEQGLTRGELEQRLVKAFGPVRAEMIAVTEVTRASAEGEKEIVKQLEAQGVKMRVIWRTNNDEIVRRCPICWPRHNEEISPNPSPATRGEWPPGHPRCRCWSTSEFASG